MTMDNPQIENRLTEIDIAAAGRQAMAEQHDRAVEAKAAPTASPNQAARQLLSRKIALLRSKADYHTCLARMFDAMADVLCDEYNTKEVPRG